jgi:DNA-binding response OmpR family regulator
MEFPALRGRSILVVEDEMLIGMDIRAALEQAGAQVSATTTVRHALAVRRQAREYEHVAGRVGDAAYRA